MAISGPIALYDITKYGGELLTQRFAELYDMPAYTVRLASVFGPMDRATPFRNVRNAANHIAHAAAAGRPVRATTADAVGDYIYAPDVADAIHRMLAVRRERLKHPVYNLAYGEPKDISELVAVAAEARPGSSWRSSRRPRPTSRSPTSARPGAGAPMTFRAPRRIWAGSHARWRQPSPTISTGSAPMRAEAPRRLSNRLPAAEGTTGLR
jgi:Nucleoside-diphosphate-sugar epimerases